MQFYDWRKTFAYSRARWVIVVSSRGYGKTYGLRKQCVQDWIKRKRRFVEVVRYKSELPDIARGYFDKLQVNGEFSEYEFKYELNSFYMRKVTDDNKNKWDCIGYIIALTDEQLAKRMTFSRVKRFIFDEGLIEHKDRYKRYLPREFERIVGLRSSVTRAQPGEKDDSVFYVLGNAVDYTAEIFERLGIDKIPTYGRHVYSGGDVLLDYVEPIYYDEYMRNTVVGRALAGTSEGEKLFKNTFEGANKTYVEQLPKGSKFWRGYVFNGHVYALWLSPDNFVHVTQKAPKSAKLAAFTLDDDRINYDLIRKSGVEARQLRVLFYRKLMRYESASIRERYADMLLTLGMV